MEKWVNDTKQSNCKCNHNKNFITTLKSLCDKINSDYYDMEMLAEFISDCEMLLNNPKKRVNVIFGINHRGFDLNDDTYKDIANGVKQIVEKYPEEAIYVLRWNDNYVKSNDIKVIYNVLNSLD